MQHRAAALSLAAAAAIALAACGSDNNTSPTVSKIVNFTATMTPAGEPSTSGNPTGSGTFTATLDTSTHVFTWSGTFQGLTGAPTAGHIHGPFPSGTTTSAGVILNFDPAVTPGATFVGLKTANSGTFGGTLTLTNALTFTTAIHGDSLEKLLLAGAAYVNIHTPQNGAGEIRGQITRKP